VLLLVHDLLGRFLTVLALPCLAWVFEPASFLHRTRAAMCRGVTSVITEIVFALEG